jgi:glycosyltransferase involved in cell wall biosynthesis
MKLSVAMATYNGDKFIFKQLESLKSQTRKADEVIIYDDCSTDDTAVIVRNFIVSNKLSGWRLFVGKSNCGFKRNFFKVISKTTGEIIFLCDQDDVWKVDKLEKMAEIMEKHSEILSLGTACELIDFRGRKIKSSSGFLSESLDESFVGNATIKLTAAQLSGGNMFPGCSMAFSSKIKQLYLDEAGCMLCHDYLINLLAALKNGLYYLNTPLTKYRIHSRNAIGISGEGQRPLKSDRINESVQTVRLIRKYSRQLRGDEQLFNMLMLHLSRAACLKGITLTKFIKLIRYAVKAKKLYSAGRFVADMCYILKLEKLF